MAGKHFRRSAARPIAGPPGASSPADMSAVPAGGYCCLLEGDPLWRRLLSEAIAGAGVPVQPVGAGELLANDFSLLTGASAIVADWSQIHGGPIIDGSLSRQARGFVRQLLGAEFPGPLVLVSGATKLHEVKANLECECPGVRVFTFPKAYLDWDVLAELVCSFQRPGRDVERPNIQEQLLEGWDRLLRGSEDRTGRRLEDAAAGMFEWCGHQVVRNIRTVSGELDIVVWITEGYSSIFDPKFILVECKNRQAAVSASDLEILIAKMDKISASIGLVISRRGFSGDSSQARDAKRVAEDLVLKTGGKSVILALSFGECRDVVQGTRQLWDLLDRKALDERIRRINRL